MKSFKRKLFGFALLLSTIFSACNLMSEDLGNSDLSENQNNIITRAAMTLQAMTEEVVVFPTSTPISQNDESLITAFPPVTTVPTNTQVPTNMPTTTALPPTPVPPPCDQAYFNADITVPDETIFPPGAHFTKIWQLKNIGTCTWTTDYDLMFSSGDKLNGNTLVALPYIVRPGDSLYIGVDLTAPNDPGEYLGNWKLRNANGVPFGLGQKGDVPFWVHIEVIDPVEHGIYNLASIFCAAHWKNKDENILCSGTPHSGDGFVKYDDSLKLENGTVEDEPAIWVYVSKNNYVVGEFPAFSVEAGDTFVSQIGCVYDFKTCDTEIRLDYQIEGDSTVYTLGKWDEDYDSDVTQINIDLSALAGKNVEFRLVAVGNDDGVENHIYWLNPHVSR